MSFLQHLIPRPIFPWGPNLAQLQDFQIDALENTFSQDHINGHRWTLFQFLLHPGFLPDSQAPEFWGLDHLRE